MVGWGMGSWDGWWAWAWAWHVNQRLTKLVGTLSDLNFPEAKPALPCPALPSPHSPEQNGSIRSNSRLQVKQGLLQKFESSKHNLSFLPLSIHTRAIYLSNIVQQYLPTQVKCSINSTTLTPDADADADFNSSEDPRLSVCLPTCAHEGAAHEYADTS